MRYSHFAVGLLFALVTLAHSTPVQAAQTLRIECQERGIYKITGADIRAAGMAPEDFDPKQMVLVNLDRSVPMVVKSRIFRDFGDEDYIMFFAEGADEDPTPFVNIYEDFHPPVEIFMLYPTHDKFKPLRIEQEKMRAPAKPDDGYRKISVGGREHFEENPLWEFYSGFKPNTNKERLDFIFWEKISYPASTTSRDSVTFRFLLADLAPNSPGQIKLRLFGAGEAINRNHNLKHRVKVSLNGKYEQDVEWPMFMYDAIIDVPEGVLASGMNEMLVTIEKPSNTKTLTMGVDLNFVLIDWFDVEYQQMSVVKSEYNEMYLDPERAKGDQFEFLVDGFREQGVVAMDLVNHKLYEPKSFGTDDRGRYHGINLRLEKQPAQLAIASERRILKPQKMQVREVTNYFDKPDDCELLILTHPNFMGSMQRFVDWKRSQGLKTTIVDIMDLFTENAGGYPTVETMKDFVQHIYESQPANARKLKYLLLVGDSASIAKYQSFLPAYAYLHSGTHASDNYFVSFDKPDGVADIAVGRFSVRNDEHVNHAIDKVIAYEKGEYFGPWRAKFFVIAASLQWATNDSKEIINSYSRPDFSHNYISTSQAKVSDNFFEKLTGSLVDAFNEGGLMTIFFGHGGGTVWEVGPTFERSGFTRHLFDQTNVESLANGFRNSLVFALTCYTNDFDNPNVEQTLGETFINSKGGAIAVIGSTDRSQVSTNMKFIRTCLDYMMDHQDTRLGDIFVHGKHQMRLSSVQSKYLLIGDPSLKFELPRRNLVLSNPVRTAADNQIGFDYKFKDPVKGPLKVTCQIYDRLNRMIDEHEMTLDAAEGSINYTVEDGMSWDRIRLVFYAIDAEGQDYTKGLDYSAISNQGAAVAEPVDAGAAR